MAWSSAFVDFLSAGRINPSWRVKVVQSISAWGVTDWSAATEAERLGATASIVPASVQVTGPRLNVNTWTASGGAFSFSISDVRDVLGGLTRGDILVLSLGSAGWSESQFEDICFGIVSNISANGSRQARIDCLDAMALLRNHPTDSATGSTLFHDIDGATTLTADYEGGTTMEVFDASDFEFQTGGTGLVRVNVDPPFFVTYTSHTDTKFSGCGSGALGTLHVDAPSGTSITELALLRGTPHTILSKMLTSSGTYLFNGSDDKLPSSWGLAIPWSYVDYYDLGDWQESWTDAIDGTAEWNIVAEGPVADGLAFLVAALKIGGFFPCIRQGRWTMHQATRWGAMPSDIEITDDDIAAGASAIDYRAFNEGQPYEYAGVQVTNIAGTTVFSGGDTIATLPAQVEYLSTMLNPAAQDAYIIATNTTAVFVDQADRLSPLAQRIGERLRLRCSGLRLAQLSIGEQPKLTTRRWEGRDDDGPGVSGKLGLVTAVDVDYGAGEVTVELLFRPSFDGPYGFLNSPAPGASAGVP